MEDYTFHETDAGQTKAFEFEPTLFHSLDFLFLKSSTGWKWYYCLRSRTSKVAISLYLHVSDRSAQSSIQSPFGTVECTRDILPEIVFQFLEFVEGRLRAAGVTKIVIKNHPFHYDDRKNSLLETFLFNLGYNVVDAEVGAIRFATSPFEDELNRLETRQLKKCLESGLTIRWHAMEDLEEIYSFIHRCRQLKGYVLSMTLEQLMRDAGRFPKNYLLLSAQKDNAIVAASIAVRVSSDILYNFYADHDRAYDAISPVVMVVKGLYGYCLEQNVKLLDMGTSAVNGKPNFGLLNLKMRLGGIPSTKLTFEKLLRV